MMLRPLLRDRPFAALLLVMLALLSRALIPAGYMPTDGTRSFTVMLCNDSAASTIRVSIPVNAPDPARQGKDHRGDHPCAFGSLADVSLGGADAIQLSVALNYILALGFLAVAPPVLQDISYLRPPLRGPPSLF